MDFYKTTFVKYLNITRSEVNLRIAQGPGLSF